MPPPPKMNIVDAFTLKLNFVEIYYTKLDFQFGLDALLHVYKCKNLTS